MKHLSVMEMEELGTLLGTSIRKDFSQLFEISGTQEKLKEGIIKNAVDAAVVDILKKVSSRRAPWAEQISPMDMVVIQKALYNPDEAQMKKEHIIELQHLNDDVYLLSKAMGKRPDQLENYNVFKSRWGALTKALNTATAGDGLEWMEEGFSAQMIEQVEIAAEVATLFMQFTMPTDPYTFPVKLADGEAYKGGEAIDNEPDMYRASDMTTDDLTFRSVKIIANYPYSDEAIEDAMMAILPIMKKSIAKAVAKARDNAIINGQLTADIDTGYTISSYDARYLWDGLRYLCQSALKQTGTSWAVGTGLALVRGLREDMEVYGLTSKDINIVVNTNMINKLKSVTEVSTVDKTGSVATILDGEIDKFDGMKITPSQHVFENVNATGIYDGITLSKTQLLLVNKTGFWRGNRRSFKLEQERVARKGINYLVASVREIWKPVYDTTTNPMIGWLYNIDK